MYDVTEKESFKNVKHWVSEIDKHAVDGVSKLLVGNKCDLAPKKAVSTNEAEELAISLNIRLFDSRAKSAYNVDETFYTMAWMIKQRIVSTQGRSGDGQPVHAAPANAVESAASAPTGFALLTSPLKLVKLGDAGAGGELGYPQHSARMEVGPQVEVDPRAYGRRSCAAVPVGASAEKKKEIFNEIRIILKEEEVECRKHLKKELASLELDLHLLRALFEGEVIVQSRGHTTGVTGETGPPRVAMCMATTEPEHTESSGESSFEVGGARHRCVEIYRAPTESELAESAGEFPVEVCEARPPGGEMYKATVSALANFVKLGLRLFPASQWIHSELSEPGRCSSAEHDSADVWERLAAFQP